MDIERCASNRLNAEPRMVVLNATPELRGGALGASRHSQPSPRDDGTEYDYTVYLSEADIERLRGFLVTECPNT